jgi:hypothetical protein
MLLLLIHSPSDLSAKYWLRNYLAAENIIKEGFYDVGFAGVNLESVQPLPPLQTLMDLQIDKRREVILISQETDQRFLRICQAAALNLSNRNPRQQIRQVAAVVSHAMGGTVDPSRISEFSYKFRITELKLKLGSNVLPIGRIDAGIFYHRALLFKAVCDAVGLGPCSLHRGDYNRAWNTINLKKHYILGQQSAELLAIGSASTTAAPTTSAAPSVAPAASVPAPVAVSKAPALANSAKKQSRMSTTDAALTGTRPAPGPPNESNTAVTPLNSVVMAESLSSMFPPNWSVPDEPEDSPDESMIVDLMFESGRLISMGSPEAVTYQRG